MKNKLLFLFLVLGFVSCKKYLDKKPNQSIAVPTTLVDLQSLLDQSNNLNIKRTPGLAESTSDDYFLLDQPIWRNQLT